MKVKKSFSNEKYIIPQLIDSLPQHTVTDLDLNQLLQQLPAAIYTCNAKGQITFYNEAAAVLWGRHPELGKDLWCGSWKIFEPDGTPIPLETCPMAIALKEKRPVVGKEILIERPDKRKLNVLPHPRPLFDEAGNLTGAVNMLVDITALRQMDNSYKESEARFRTLAEQAPVIVWMTDDNGNWNYVNKEWCNLTGKAYAKSMGSGWLDFVHADDQAKAKAAWSTAFSEQKQFDISFRYQKTDGNFIVVKAIARPRVTGHQQRVGFVGILQDITTQEITKSTLQEQISRHTKDLLQKNEDLRRSEERYHRMVQEVEDYAIILLSKDGIIENWNKGAEKIKGYKAEEAVGKKFWIFYTQEDLESKLPEVLIDQAKREGRANHEGWRVRKDGTLFWGSITITALHDNDNNIVGFSKVTRDLTKRRNAELEIYEKNRELEAMNQELASFAYVSSHDLQEPLRKIQTFASRILETENENLSAKGKDYFLRMQNAALRMQTLIEDLLTYSRTNTAEKRFESTDLDKVLHDVKRELAESIEEKKATITSASLPTLAAIPFQIRQLFINILSNSLKFSKAKVPPIIQITADVVKGSTIKKMPLIADKKYHHITFKDNGIGFEPEHSTKIFEVFQRLHGRSEYSGTGIGLAICKKIMDNHSGFIIAESQLDQGAAFHVYFPM